MRRIHLAKLLVILLIAVNARAQDRLPPIPSEKMSADQKKAVDDFRTARQAEPSGPFWPLLRSPELMTRGRALGDYLRYRSALPPRLSEFVILLTSRQWTQPYEWNVHYHIAVNAGLNPNVAKAIAEGRRPDGLTDDEELLYTFCLEVQKNQSVSDATYKRALSRFGEQGVVDTVGIVGYYSLLAMVLNTARTPAGASAAVPLAVLPALADSAGKQAEQEVRQVERLFNEARARADVTTLEKILADEWTITHSDGSTDTKTQYLSDLRSGARKFDFVKQDEIPVRLYGDPAAAFGFPE